MRWPPRTSTAPSRRARTPTYPLPHPHLPAPSPPPTRSRSPDRAPALLPRGASTLAKPPPPKTHTHNPHRHQEFESAIATHAEHLNADPIISHHLSSLYDMLLQENIIRVIEPYSNVETSHF